MEPITRTECNQTRTMFMKEIKDIKRDVNDIKVELAGLPERILEKLDEKYVSKDSFEPVKKITYSLVGVVLTSIIVAVLALVLR